MIKKDKFFFFGFGQTAKYFVKELTRSNKKCLFFATSSKKKGDHFIDKKKIKFFKFNNKGFDKDLLNYLEKTEYILVSIPPIKNTDIVLKTFSKFFRNLNFKKIIYLSATSVYGNHQGKLVNEKSKLKGKTKLGKRRKLAEKAWIKFRNSTKFNINILRISGIYSQESNVLKKIIQNNIRVKEKKFFSRIRIEDLAIIIKKLFYSSKNSLILNASDDKPSSNIEVANYAAKLLKIKLKPIPISKFKNKMIKEFYKDSKKVSNKNMKKKLNIKLKYPTYKEGLRNIFNNLK
tara:strand:- start:253 stop:1122 length:870 start_codon:yes stop_codon:yes gene_type:complete